MDAKSLDMLEFPRIREMISGYAAFSGGREMAAELRPLTDYPAITHLLAQTAEARELLSLDRSFTVGDVTDIREHASPRRRASSTPPCCSRSVPASPPSTSSSAPSRSTPRTTRSSGKSPRASWN